MEMKIDLKELYSDYEDGPVSAAIKTAVEKRIANEILPEIRAQVTASINALINDKVDGVVREMLTKAADDIMNYEYTEVSSYGTTKKTWTVRNRILKSVEELCTFNQQNYSRENYFTSLIKQTVAEEVKKFRQTFDAEVDLQFRREALAYATKELGNKLGIPGK